MAINVETSAPKGLLGAIKKAIDEKHVQTWEYDKDGDFTHTATQWNRKAWLRPSTENGALRLTIVPPQNSTISTEIYAIYHGRFVEMLLAHFDQSFSEVSVTAVATSGDILKGSGVVG
jgi:hypothetical protein